jgi:hypothetical protein
MRVWTRAQSWCKIPVLSSSHIIPRPCGGRGLSTVARVHHTPTTNCVQLQRSRQKTANCRLSPLSAQSFISSAAPQMASLTTPGAPDEYRLPTTVKPTHYDVTIKTDLEDQTFEGFVRIEYVSLLAALSSNTSATQTGIRLDVKEATSRIVLNTSGLDLGKAYGLKNVICPPKNLMPLLTLSDLYIPIL